MFLPDDPTAVAGQYVDGTPGGAHGTSIRADHMNALTNEIANAVTAFGGALNKSDSTQLRAVLMTISRLAQEPAVKAALTLREIYDTAPSITARAIARKYDPDAVPQDITAVVGDGGKISHNTNEAPHTFAASTVGNGYTGIFRDVLFDVGNLKWIAVGDVGEIQASVSSDASAWTRQATGGATLRAIACNGAAYGSVVTVAVGDAETIKTSPDGAVWTTRSGPFSGSPNILAVAFGAGVFVAVSSAGDIATSPDGVTWTVRASFGGSHTAINLQYEATLGFFVHFGVSVWRSVDGITWNPLLNANGTVDAGSEPPGLLLLPNCWVLAYSDALATSCHGRFSLALNAPPDFTISYIATQRITWWRVIRGQIWATSGDKMYVGGAV